MNVYTLLLGIHSEYTYCCGESSSWKLFMYRDYHGKNNCNVDDEVQVAYSWFTLCLHSIYGSVAAHMINKGDSSVTLYSRSVPVTQVISM